MQTTAPIAAGQGGRVLYGDRSYAILSCAFEVHRVLGPGFSERIYEEALARELEHRGIPFRRQERVPVFYKDRQVGDMYLTWWLTARSS